MTTPPCLDRVAFALALTLLLGVVSRSRGAEPPTGSTNAVAVTSGLTIPYKLDKPGQVSLGVFDASGYLVRTLLCGEKQTAGTFTATWDGLDRYGNALPPGAYEWRLLRTPGFSREFLVNVGIQTPWAPYGVWPGNHFGPSLVHLDEDGSLFVGTVSSEGPPHLLKMALDGSKEIWDTGTWGLPDGLRDMARIGDVLYLLMGTTIEIRRADNGSQVYGIPKLRRFAEQRLPFVNLLHAGDDPRKESAPMTMAGGRDYLAVTYRDRDEVRFLWPREDTIARDKTIAVAKPAAITIAGDGRVFVVSASNIVKVNPETGETTVVVRDVPSPGKLAYDPTFDDLLVVSGGKCIRRYHAADGKLVAVYGRPEGRTYGLFNPLDFDDILDITADGKGGFVMVEQYPRRVAHFSGREKHELVNQWIGGMQWGAVCAFDPADPTIVYIPIDPKHLGRGKIDIANHRWTLTHLYDMTDDFCWEVGKDRHRAMLPSLSASSYWDVVHRAGQTYLVNRGYYGGAGCTILKVDEAANKLVPLAHIGGLHPTVDRNNPPAWWLAACKLAGFEPNTRVFMHSAFSWSDANHNGKVDVDEIRLGAKGYYAIGHCFVDDNWNVYFPTNGPSPWTVVKNEGTLDLPVWDWNHAHPADAAYDASDYAIANPNACGIWRDKGGNVYAIANNDNHKGDLFDVPPMTWPNNASHSQRIMKWDASGRLDFTVGRHTDRKDGQPGQFASIRAILGRVKDCLIVMDACSAASAWTADGLDAGAFNDDVNVPAFTELKRGETGPWQAMAYRKITHDDNQWGQVVESPAGEVLWGLMRDNNTAMYRVTGWEGWERQQGKVTVTAAFPAPRHAGAGLSGDYYSSADLTGNSSLARIDPAIWFGPMWGDHRAVETKNAWFPKDAIPALNAGACSARWTGFIEAPVSEDFTFHVYTYGSANHARDGQQTTANGAKVRIWIDGKLLIDSWDNVTPKKVEGFVRTRGLKSPPLPMRAAELAAIKIEYSAAGDKDAHLHLFWESKSSDLRHVPASALYTKP